MPQIHRLPAIPLIASDPYFSVWMPADTLTQTDSCHWSGPAKPVRGVLVVDGVACRFLGAGLQPEATLSELTVSATQTRFVSEFGGVRLETRFVTPALPDDLDLLSMPVTLVTFSAVSTDGAQHQVQVQLHLSDRLCYDGEIRPAMAGETLCLDGRDLALCGQKVQKPLCHSGDHVTTDWGYLYLSADGKSEAVGDGVQAVCSLPAHGQPVRAVIAYDDIASINYFGDLCKAWYRRDGRQITDAIRFAWQHFDRILNRCAALDEQLEQQALAAGGEEYVQLVNAAWRQTLAAHKLIATPKGEMAYLSKENDSNGCIGTVDVSYPSIPLFLRFCPELVNALCRPVLEFASMPVWTDDFAPHDVGRYPLATGQVYAALKHVGPGECYPPYYLYPAGSQVYDPRYQMPVEECGNMLIMLQAARAFGADAALADQYRPLLDKWVRYLTQYGEDPGEQLCTDDFAGHLAHNVNLAAKAVVGVACYARLTDQPEYMDKARTMAARLLEKMGDKGNTPLTLDGQGWSMKYNLLWDKVLDLGLLPREFYDAELASYLPRINRYGLPLDSRADYTKSDWICWVAAMADDPATRTALLAPVARMLRESDSRVPFSDWYDTKTGRYMAFIARSVQGGVLALLLR